MEMDDLREGIDRADGQLLDAFGRRMRLALEIGRQKRDGGRPILDPEREREVLGKALQRCDEDLGPYVTVLYNTLFELSRSYQRRAFRLRSDLEERITRAASQTPNPFPKQAEVACLEAEGGYAKQACHKLFAAPGILYRKRLEDVFQAVESGLCRYGVLPMEHGSAGSVPEVYGLLRKHRFFIARSVRLQTDAASGGDIRFLCVAKEMEIYPGADKISLMLTVERKPGALYAAIAGFAALGLNLIRLESRPIAGADSALLLHVDVDAAISDREVLRLLGELDTGPERLTFLGAYAEI